MATIEIALDKIAECDLDAKFRFKGGRTWYDAARYTRYGKTIRVCRLDTSDGLRQINRYVPFDSQVMLRLNSEAREKLGIQASGGTHASEGGE